MQTQIRLFSPPQNKTSPTPQISWELPNLSAANTVSLDTETTGLKLWKGDRPVGLSISVPEGNAWYIPWGHARGFNFELEKVKEWFKDNLSGKEALLTNAKFDINMLKHVGIDMEELGIKPREVMHLPALLYSTRKNYDLNTMAQEFVGREKLEMPDIANLWHKDSADVALYAMEDARLTFDIDDVLRQRIADEDLETVRDLEDSILYCVASMEWQGANIDTERLEIWGLQIQSRYVRNVMRIHALTGIRCEPTKDSHVAKLFAVLKVHTNYFTPKGKESFSVEAMQEFAHLEPIRLAIECKQLKSLKAKFIDGYKKAIGDDGKIRYALNQLKASNDEGSKGAVTGRFSSSGGGSAISGINIQQVYDEAKQETIPCIADFPIRDLFLPEPNHLWTYADARQIEFRIFAHYSKSKRLLKAYEDDPLVDFHSYVAKEILHVPRDKKLKNMNFGKIYGMGVNKLAEVYLKLPIEEVQPLNDHYDREFPEAKRLMQEAMDAAKEKGYVRTILGRRRRYTKEDMRYSEREGKKVMPWWSALNAVIQGSAADIMKRKLLEVYSTRKETGFRMMFTVHDEVDGDVPNIESAQKVNKILNQQTTPLRVPILWKTCVGSSWAKTEDI